MQDKLVLFAFFPLFLTDTNWLFISNEVGIFNDGFSACESQGAQFFVPESLDQWWAAQRVASNYSEVWLNSQEVSFPNDASVSSYEMENSCKGVLISGNSIREEECAYESYFLCAVKSYSCAPIENARLLSAFISQQVSDESICERNCKSTPGCVA